MANRTWRYIQNGVAWTGVEKVLVHGMGFAQGLILARLLCPEDFGLAAMLWIFIGIGTTLAESGLGTAYIIYGGNAGKVFRWNIGIGCVLYGCIIAVSPSVASFYAQDILAPLLCVMGLGIVLSAACVLGNARLQREKRFGELSVVNVASVLFGFIVATSMASCGCGVWSIAFAGIAAAAFRIVFFAAKKILWQGEREPKCDFKYMLGYGLRLTGSGLIHTIYLNSYNLLIGKLFAPSDVGMFSRGQRWATLPTDVANEAVGRIALPDMAQCRASAMKYTLLNVAILWPLLAALWIFAEQIVGFVLGANWLDCVPYLRILIFGVFFTPVTNISLQYIRAKGRSDLVLATDAIKKPIQFMLLAYGGWMSVSGRWIEGVAVLCWMKVASDIVEAATDAIAAFCLARRV